MSDDSRREVYADHAATTPPAPEALEAMASYLKEEFGNASSVHRRGEAARAALDLARERVADAIGATPEEIVFVASGSEANNLALKGLMLGALPERRRLIVSSVEHPSVLETARHLETRGVPLTIVPVDANGLVDLERLRAEMRPDVALVSIQMVNNETGVIQPVAEIAELAHAAGARFHTDAVQAVGKLALDVRTFGVDLLSLAGHKFGGPLGAAALYVRRRVRLVPLVHGGHQERSRRAGTENLPAVVGLGVAAERAAHRLAEHRAQGARMGEALRAGLAQAVPDARLNGDPERRVESIVNVRFPGVDGEAILHELDLAGITVSTGSACSAASLGPSSVLLAMGLSPEEAHGSVRFSFGDGNDETQVSRILQALPPILARLRALASEPERSIPRSA
jgi:cysteine desulfurase